MLKIKVKTETVRFSIPVPYFILTIGVSILSSEFLYRKINKLLVKHKENEEKEISFTMPLLNKKELKTIIKELKKHKGLELVNVKSKDDTEVRIRA
jgi:hypothetical protein